MKLWLLEAVDEHYWSTTGPWGDVWESNRAHVVRADCEITARKFAQAKNGTESSFGRTPWLDPKYTTCTELNDNGLEGIVITDSNGS